jgi:hypothetical protein
MIRKIFSVIAGYAIFAITALALLKLSGQNPHASATTSFQLLTAIYGVFFSILSGFVLRVIAQTRNLGLNFILALIIAGFAALSMLTSAGSHWTQWFAICFFAPASVLGGFFYQRKRITKS